MKGTVVDSKYQIVGCLGEGGMGAVYEARHLGTGRRVALKMIMPEALKAGGDIIPRFRREARASGAIDSEHVVQVLDTGVDPVSASPYLVMEYLSGEDLQQVVKREGPLPPDTVLRIITQACAGLTRAHETGIIHRDIKSANLFVSRREGGEITIKILDFGIAKVRADPLSSSGNQAITRTGALLGSPLYMSPEQVLGSKDLDPRSDVFSLGVTMYEALCGATPNHDVETVGMLVVAITNGRVPPIQDRAPWVPREVAAIVHKALSVDPSARFQSTAEMHAAITALLTDGASLRESMLKGVAPDVKRVVSSKLVQMTVPLRTPMPALSPVPPPPPAATAATATSFTDSTPVTIPTRPAWHIAVPVAVLLLGGGAGVAFGTHRSHGDAPAASSTASAAHSSSASASASATASASAAASAALEASGTLPPAAVPSDSVTVVRVEADAAIAAGSAPAADAGLHAHPRPLVMSAAGPAPAPAPAPAPTVNCDPPYTFNAEGKKIWKRECL